MIMQPAGEPCQARLLIEQVPHSGAWNMAVDEALLQAAVDEDVTTLRVYRWNEPTISLGYFQKSRDEIPVPSLRSLPVVRRITGGGAILHDREWTYSCALPAGHPLSGRAEALYDFMHAAIARAFQTLGVTLRPRGQTHHEAAEPFLCFLRADARDLLLGEHKVVGSAQRRRKGAVLQHGSVLLEHSARLPDVPGIFDLQPGTSATLARVAGATAKARPMKDLAAMPAFVDACAEELFRGTKPVVWGNSAEVPRLGKFATEHAGNHRLPSENA